MRPPARRLSFSAMPCFFRERAVSAPWSYYRGMTRRKADIRTLHHGHVVVKRPQERTEWARWFAHARCECDLTQQRIADLTGISVYRQGRWVEDGDLPSLEELRLMAEVTGSEYGDLLVLCGYITEADMARLAQRASLASIPSEELAAEFYRRAEAGPAPAVPALSAVAEELFEEREAEIDHRELAAVRVRGGELILCAEHAEGHDPLVLSKFVADDGARTDVWFTQETAQEVLALFKEGLRVVGNWYDRQASWPAYGSQRIRLGTATAFSRDLMIYVELAPGADPRIISVSSASQAPSSCVEFTHQPLAEYVERLREGVSLLKRWA
jgi:transcriptional regulator with XRE-family HTH domain